ncbi:hypothetical protein GCM10027416_02300 [Okibacterium endophyticum]
MKQERVDTGLVWGIKNSLIDYLARVGDASSQVSAGAGLVGPGEFYFAVADTSGFDGSTLTGTIRFRGELRLRAHSGLLAVDVRDPWLEFGDEGWTLTSEVGGEHKPVSNDSPSRARLVDLEPVDVVNDGEVIMLPDVPTRLAAESAGLFDGMYPVGTAFAPLHVRVARTAPGALATA